MQAEGERERQTLYSYIGNNCDSLTTGKHTRSSMPSVWSELRHTGEGRRRQRHVDEARPLKRRPRRAMTPDHRRRRPRSAASHLTGAVHRAVEPAATTLTGTVTQAPGTCQKRRRRAVSAEVATEIDGEWRRTSAHREADSSATGD